MPKYKHIFFDLDRTLWDFEKNSVETLTDIFYKYKLDEKIESPEVFIKKYKEINEELWAKYRTGEIKKEFLRNQRFLLSLQHFGINDSSLAESFGTDYIEISPTKTILFPNTVKTLEYLSQKYTLHIITNGFKEVQHVKLKNNKLDKYFDKVITSETVGYQKPNAKIFQHSLSTSNAKKEESLMIGDDLKIDILGAKSFGMNQVFFNTINTKHNEKVTHEITDLKELTEFL